MRTRNSQDETSPCTLRNEISFKDDNYQHINDQCFRKMMSDHEKQALDYKISLSRLLKSKSIQKREVDTLISAPTFSTKFWKQHLAYYLKENDMYPLKDELTQDEKYMIRKALVLLRQQYKLEVHTSSDLYTIASSASHSYAA